ncbi:MAG: response regulator [Gammaproteobacteria bacterium]|nr:response regulator [Gammaproteobacteria bacterium]
MAKKIKVLIVDDASFMVKALRDILESDDEIEVVGSARNGQDALDKIPELQPDVVTLDVDMPVMDGVRAIRHIMIKCPIPIVMLSSLFSHGDITFEALRLGVVDFLPKPSGAISTDIHSQGHQIIDRVKIAAAENIRNVHRVKLNKVDVRDQLVERYGFQMLDHLVTIGTTLGGPNTVIRIMSELSPDLPMAVVAIQEIEPRILPAFVKEFNEYTAWKVEEGKEGTILEQGVCYVCSYSEPMIVQLNSNQEPCLMRGTNGKKPLNALFQSAADVFEQNTVGVLLTGVGNDGEEGFSHIKKKSGVTIAQNTETCVYPNLTQCAIEYGVVDFVANDGDLHSKIATVVNTDSDERVMNA